MTETTTRRSEEQLTNRAITAKDSKYTDSLLGTDRRAVRRIVSKIEEYSGTSVDSVEVARYGELLSIEIRGEIALSYKGVESSVNTDVYSVDNIMTYSNGNMCVDLTTR